MAVYVDELRAMFFDQYHKKWVWAMSCHMMADTNEELEAMARRCRVRPQWRHGDHYDLTTRKRDRALQLGAIAVDSRKLVRLRQHLRNP